MRGAGGGKVRGLTQEVPCPAGPAVGASGNSPVITAGWVPSSREPGAPASGPW